MGVCVHVTPGWEVDGDMVVWADCDFEGDGTLL